jgi:mannose-1-phosphate guanylyltransferase
MAGGIGTRFWPASREHLPKQFLDIAGTGKSLIQMTFDRFASFIPADHIYVITHRNLLEQTKSALPEISESNIITEPSRNNTAPAIALASFKLIEKDPSGVCIVAPADHMIQNEKEFQKVILDACKHAEEKHSLITLGIRPTRPDTGYGYIEFDQDDSSHIRKVKSFREKPTTTDAIQYLSTGHFAWNSGIFIWRFKDILAAFLLHCPQIYDILIRGKESYNTYKEQIFIDEEYPKTEKISVDYAILEKAENVYTIPADIGWSDLGTWASLYDQSAKDENQNAVLSKPVYLEDAQHNLVFSKNPKLIVVKGLKDFIIVDTDDCLLIYPKSEEQAIKSLKAKLKDEGQDNCL